MDKNLPKLALGFVDTIIVVSQVSISFLFIYRFYLVKIIGNILVARR